MPEEDALRVLHAVRGLLSLVFHYVLVPLILAIAIIPVTVLMPIWEAWWKNRTTREQREQHLEAAGGVGAGIDALKLWITRADVDAWYEKQEWYDDK